MNKWFKLMSSLEQLVKMGLLDKDFLDLPKSNTEVEVVREESSDEESSDEMKVAYMPRDQTTPTPSSRRPQAQVEPEDLNLEYYQTIQYHWLYSSQSYGWWHFSVTDNDALEEEYQSNSTAASIDINGQTFNFNFTRMTQRGSGRNTRQILRVTSLTDIALRGVAGSRIEKRDITSAIITKDNFITTEL
jgi:hypothetical protein